jgi:hypothetical protein
MAFPGHASYGNKFGDLHADGENCVLNSRSIVRAACLAAGLVSFPNGVIFAQTITGEVNGEPRVVLIERPKVGPMDPGISRYYPDVAMRMNIEGSATVRCVIKPAWRLDKCAVLSEEPAGWGFGNATVRMFRALIVKPANPGEVIGTDALLTRTVNWHLPPGSTPAKAPPGVGPVSPAIP